MNLHNRIDRPGEQSLNLYRKVEKYIKFNLIAATRHHKNFFGLNFSTFQMNKSVVFYQSHEYRALL